MYSFDGQNRIVSLDIGVLNFDVNDLYSRWKDWVLADNAEYANAFNTIGGEPISSDGSQVISPYFFFVNGWKIRPQEADHQLTITGNLLSLDGTQPTIQTLGDFDVYVRTILSVNSTTTSVSNTLTSEQLRDAIIAGLQATNC